MRDDTELYYNTLCDEFYVGGHVWSDFDILIHIMANRNTIRPLPEDIARKLNRLLDIRILIVDFTVFGAVPASFWAEFSKLNYLTIAFYPFATMLDPERDDALGYDDFPVPPKFLLPQAGSKYGKRGDWIVKSVTKSLEIAKRADCPGWKLPEVRAVVRRTGYEIDNMIREAEYSEESDCEEEWNDEGEPPDDSTWYKNAQFRLTHTIPQDVIKSLMEEHEHPS